MTEKGRITMKFTKIKKMIVMGLAAMTAVSAMSMSAFAAEENLVAELEDSNGNIVSVYEDDLIDGRYSIESDGLTITVEVKPASDLFAARALSKTFTTMKPYYPVDLDANGTQSLSFSASKLDTVYSPYLYVSSGSKKVVYDFAADDKYNTSVKGTVIVQDSSGQIEEKNYSVSLGDTKSHSVTISGLSSTQTTYASVYNGYKSDISGTCRVF